MVYIINEWNTFIHVWVDALHMKQQSFLRCLKLPFNIYEREALSVTPEQRGHAGLARVRSVSEAGKQSCLGNFYVLWNETYLFYVFSIVS